MPYGLNPILCPLGSVNIRLIFCSRTIVSVLLAVVSLQKRRYWKKHCRCRFFTPTVFWPASAYFYRVGIETDYQWKRNSWARFWSEKRRQNLLFHGSCPCHSHQRRRMVSEVLPNESRYRWYNHRPRKFVLSPVFEPFYQLKTDIAPGVSVDCSRPG